MAETPTVKNKRLVKNPETFRERAIKASETTDRPRRFVKFKNGLGKLLKPVFSPIGHFFSKLFKIQPFKFIAKLFYWLGLVIFPRYLRKSWQELKFVAWPTLKQSRQLTFAVLVFAIVFGASVALVDLGLDKLFKNILLK
jgi:preprotein translocase SecE subunit